jgi:hypothetical protein
MICAKLFPRRLGMNLNPQFKLQWKEAPTEKYTYESSKDMPDAALK